jgi:hypothetical protein
LAREAGRVRRFLDDLESVDVPRLGDLVGVDVDADHMTRLADPCCGYPGHEPGTASQVDDPLSGVDSGETDEVFGPLEHELGDGALIALTGGSGDLETGSGSLRVCRVLDP